MKTLKLLIIFTGLIILPTTGHAQDASSIFDAASNAVNSASQSAQKASNTTQKNLEAIKKCKPFAENGKIQTAQINCYANLGINTHCSKMKQSEIYKKEQQNLQEWFNQATNKAAGDTKTLESVNKEKDKRETEIETRYTKLEQDCLGLAQQYNTVGQISNQKIFAGSCITTERSYENQVGECLPQNLSKEQEILQQALDNQYIYQILEEPLGTENLLKRQTTCNYKFLKNKDGFYQTVNQNSTLKPADKEYYNQEFTIIADTCYEFFVDDCQPKPVQSNKLKIIDDFGDTNELPVSVTCKTVQLIYGSSGTGFIKQYVSFIYRLAVGIVGVIAVLVIVVSGIQISVAGDDSAKISEAKERIIRSLFGLAVLFLAGLILRSVNPNFFTDQDIQINNPTTTQTTNS